MIRALPLYNAQDIQPKLTDGTAGTIIETGVARMHMDKRKREINDLAKWLRTEAFRGIK